MHWRQGVAVVLGANPEFGVKRLPRRPVAESVVILIAQDPVPMM